MPYVKNQEKAERMWVRRGLIWRTLAIHAGMTPVQLSNATGLPNHIVYYELGMTHDHPTVMSGVYRGEKGLWHAEGVTQEWLEVL